MTSTLQIRYTSCHQLRISHFTPELQLTHFLLTALSYHLTLPVLWHGRRRPSLLLHYPGAEPLDGYRQRPDTFYFFPLEGASRNLGRRHTG